MYVNALTLEMGERGRRAIEEFLRRGAEAGIVPHVGSIVPIA
jgi:predicted solute-binding protein